MITSLEQLLDLMRHHGATRIYAKRLASNDNSKQQVYLGGGFAALNIIPHGDIIIDTSERAGAKQDRPKALVNFYWIDENGRHPAPGANLILYPDYPEVRLSGFLRGCRAAPNAIMTVREEGRLLVLGMTPEGDVLAHALAADSPIAAELLAQPPLEEPAVAGLDEVVADAPGRAVAVGVEHHRFVAQRLRGVHEHAPELAAAQQRFGEEVTAAVRTAWERVGVMTSPGASV